MTDTPIALSPADEPTKSIAQIAKESGVSKSAIRKRKMRGQALEGPKRGNKGTRICKSCGGAGHYAKTCGRASLHHSPAKARRR